STLTEASEFVGSGAFTDPESNDTWTATVNYGDGSGAQPLALAADRTFQLRHRYADNGIYPLTVTVTDRAGATGSTAQNISVTNQPPVISGVNYNGPIVPGLTFTLSVTASDPAVDRDPLTYEFDFNNDGQYEISSPVASVNHVFADAGY